MYIYIYIYTLIYINIQTHNRTLSKFESNACAASCLAASSPCAACVGGAGSSANWKEGSSADTGRSHEPSLPRMAYR